MIPSLLYIKVYNLQLWSKVSQIFLSFSLYVSSLNLKYMHLEITKMDITHFAMKHFKYSYDDDYDDDDDDDDSHHLYRVIQLWNTSRGVINSWLHFEIE